MECGALISGVAADSDVVVAATREGDMGSAPKKGLVPGRGSTRYTPPEIRGSGDPVSAVVEGLVLALRRSVKSTPSTAILGSALIAACEDGSAENREDGSLLLLYSSRDEAITLL